MNAAVCKIKLFLPENHSLKEKRRIIKSVMGKLRNQYNISIAEVEDQDLWQIATIGVSIVASSQNHVDEMIDRMLEYIRLTFPDIEVINHDIEVMHGF
jgi:uncharacterized protein